MIYLYQKQGRNKKRRKKQNDKQGKTEKRSE